MPLTYCLRGALTSHQIQAVPTGVLGWHPTNQIQLAVYVFQFFDRFPASEQGFSVLTHLQAGQHELHVVVEFVNSELNSQSSLVPSKWLPS